VIEVCFVVLPNTLLLDLAGPAEAFRLANQYLHRLGKACAFQLRYVGPSPEPLSSVGLQLTAIGALPSLADLRTTTGPRWFVLMGRPGEFFAQGRKDRLWLTTRNWLSNTVRPELLLPESKHRLMTVCEGALLAADAGLITTQRCTTHHEVLDHLARLVPKAEVVGNRVFMIDGFLASSAGITAGIDLSLHLIAQVCGDAVAAQVAQVMVAYTRRTEAHSASSALLSARHHLHAGLHRLQNAITLDPAKDWSLTAMTHIAHVTPRHLLRLFKQVQSSPTRYVAEVRMALAAEYLQQGKTPTQAADLVGWNPRQLRAWRQKLGKPGKANSRF
jgi:transcriptional regulator GlxA family with amidase domain